MRSTPAKTVQQMNGKETVGWHKTVWNPIYPFQTDHESQIPWAFTVVKQLIIGTHDNFQNNFTPSRQLNAPTQRYVDFPENLRIVCPCHNKQAYF